MRDAEYARDKDVFAGHGTRITEHGSPHPFFLGVDAGGTRTRAIVASCDGAGAPPRAVGAGQAGPANWTTLGPERCARAISAAVEAALEAVELPVGALTGACVAMAGYYPPWHELEARTVLSPLLRGVTLILEPDLVAAWAGALGGRPGIALVAGTGAVAYGRNGAGTASRAGGWGPLFGDEGSGYWIGCQALRAVAQSLDGRGTATSLVEGLRLRVEGTGTDRARGQFSIEDSQLSIENPPTPSPEEVLRSVYRDGWPRERVAALAMDVARHAAAGDGVARGIQERAAAELGALIAAVSRRLAWGSSSLPVATAGGVLENGSGLRGDLERWVAAVLPHVCFVEPLGSPVEGALLLAQAEAGEWLMR